MKFGIVKVYRESGRRKLKKKMGRRVEKVAGCELVWGGDWGLGRSRKEDLGPFEYAGQTEVMIATFRVPHVFTRRRIGRVGEGGANW